MNLRTNPLQGISPTCPFYFLYDDCACQKLLAIRAVVVSLLFIFVCFALAVFFVGGAFLQLINYEAVF